MSFVLAAGGKPMATRCSEGPPGPLQPDKGYETQIRLLGRPLLPRANARKSAPAGLVLTARQYQQTLLCVTLRRNSLAF